MATVDASIPLSAIGAPQMTTAQALTLADMIEQRKERQEERPYRMEALRAQSQQNALSLQQMQLNLKKSQGVLKIAQTPGMMDENGIPTADAVKAGMSIDPEIGKAWGEQRRKYAKDKLEETLTNLQIKEKNGEIGPNVRKNFEDTYVGLSKLFLDRFNKATSAGDTNPEFTATVAVQEEAERRKKASLINEDQYKSILNMKWDKHAAEGVVAYDSPQQPDSADIKLLEAAGFKKGTPDFQKAAKELLKKKEAPTYAQIMLGGVGALSPETLRLTAEQYLAGDRTAAVGYARNPQMQAALRNEITKVATEYGMSGRDIAQATAEYQGMVQGERTVGTRQAQIEMAGNVVAKFIPLAKQRSEEYKRYGIKSVNDLQNAVLSRTASPELRRLNAAVNAVVNAYARAVNPSGVGTVDDKAEARKILDSGFASGDFDAAADQLMMEIEAELKAPGAVKKGMREFFQTGPGGKAPPPEAGRRDAESGAIVKPYTGNSGKTPGDIQDLLEKYK